VEYLGRNTVRADEDVHAIVIFPKMSNLHQVEVAWLA
jgi:hypothetical protein